VGREQRAEIRNKGRTHLAGAAPNSLPALPGETQGAVARMKRHAETVRGVQNEFQLERIRQLETAVPAMALATAGHRQPGRMQIDVGESASHRGNMKSTAGDFFRFDRSRVEFGSLEQEPDDVEYWLRQPPAARLAGIEFLRRQFYSYGEARREFRRLLEIAQSPRG